MLGANLTPQIARRPHARGTSKRAFLGQVDWPTTTSRRSALKERQPTGPRSVQKTKSRAVRSPECEFGFGSRLRGACYRPIVCLYLPLRPREDRRSSRCDERSYPPDLSGWDCWITPV